MSFSLEADLPVERKGEAVELLLKSCLSVADLSREGSIHAVELPKMSFPLVEATLRKTQTSFKGWGVPICVAASPQCDTTVKYFVLPDTNVTPQ